MGTRYSTVLTGGVIPTFNDSPPPDDGSQTEANRVKWSTVKDKIGSPLHSGTINVDDNLIAHFNEGPKTISTNYTTDADDYNSVLECTGSPDISLLAPATGGKSYRVTINNVGSGTVEVDVSGGGNINGNACHKLGPNQGGTYFVNDAENAYYLKHTSGEFPDNTKMVFYQSSAPTGWTKDSTPDESVLRVTDSSPTGGTNGGAYDFQNTFVNVLSEAGTPGIGNHTLTAAQSGVGDHIHRTQGQTSQDNIGSVLAGTIGTPTNIDTGGVLGGGTPASQGHSHTLDLRVKWAAVIIATKDGGCGGGGGPS